MSEPTAPPVPAGPSLGTGPIPPYFGPMGRTERTAAAPQPRPADGGTPADTAEAPAVLAGATAVPAGATAATADPGPADAPTVAGPAVPEPDAPLPPAGTFATTPVTSRPSVRARRRDPLIRMGPWAPAAGALAGLVAGLVAALVLAGRADAFGQRLALVFLVVGLTMLGAAGALLADEVRIVRRGARDAVVRPASVEATAGLINGLTPARLLLGASAFVLFLAAYVGR